MKSGQIDCPAPSPEDPADARSAKLLVPAPSMVPEKKATKKATGTQKSARCQEVSGSSSDGSKAHSSREDEEEEEETSPPPAGGGKKRKAAPVGGAKGPRRGKPLRRITPPTPTRTKRSGRTGPSIRRNRKCSDTRVTHDIPFVAQLSLMSNIIMQPAPGRTQRVVERLPGFIGCELCSSRYLPPHCR